ncbi:hypothetical protein EHS13_04610 [Paenibacillus psychroresistens]|uniref:Gfo/Idh/MocA-like oxidoreductase C-terminal domain-containing protein n=1 Tax=Paenibacillus psychroresistens TaxID=1778678 RepID=A0A6B8RFN5_9BACL|nr:hypothetical protein [Paenibacillus psychroresistens]QGQ94238.1 hypothetical protein EHS13_04610 [Paenibacillus psychroresistens]
MQARGSLVAASCTSRFRFLESRLVITFHMLPGENKEILFHQADSEKGVITSRVWSGSESWDTLHSGLMSDFASAIIEDRPPMGTLEEAYLA